MSHTWHSCRVYLYIVSMSWTYFLLKTFNNKSPNVVDKLYNTKKILEKKLCVMSSWPILLEWSSSLVAHWKKKWSHFDLKSWVTGGTKIWTGIPSYWRIFESNWLDTESQFDFNITSQFDSNILQLLGIPGWNLVPPVTQLFRSKWLHFFFECSIANVIQLIQLMNMLWVSSRDKLQQPLLK